MPLIIILFYEFYIFINLIAHELSPYDFNTLYELYNNGSTNFFIRDNDNNRCRIFNPPSINDEFAGFVELTLDYKKSRKANELLFIISLDNSSFYNYFEINFESIIINTTSLTVPSALVNRDPNKDLKNVNTTLISNKYFITRQYVIYKLILIERIYYSSHFFGLLGLKANNTMTFLEIENKLISNIGGFYGAVSGIFVLLFGASKLSPW